TAAVTRLIDAERPRGRSRILPALVDRSAGRSWAGPAAPAFPSCGQPEKAETQTVLLADAGIPGEAQVSRTTAENEGESHADYDRGLRSRPFDIHPRGAALPAGGDVHIVGGGPPGGAPAP